jgi:prevent-host-death family protein
METIDINKALPQINQLLEKAATGEEIIITRNNHPMVKLVSTQTSPKRPPLFGSDKNIISISDDFDEPLEDFKDYM